MVVKKAEFVFMVVMFSIIQVMGDRLGEEDSEKDESTKGIQ